MMIKDTDIQDLNSAEDELKECLKLLERISLPQSRKVKVHVDEASALSPLKKIEVQVKRARDDDGGSEPTLESSTSKPKSTDDFNPLVPFAPKNKSIILQTIGEQAQRVVRDC